MGRLLLLSILLFTGNVYAEDYMTSCSGYETPCENALSCFEAGGSSMDMGMVSDCCQCTQVPGKTKDYCTGSGYDCIAVFCSNVCPAPPAGGPSIDPIDAQTIDLPTTTTALFTARATTGDPGNTIDSLTWIIATQPAGSAISLAPGDSTTNANPKINPVTVNNITVPGLISLSVTARNTPNATTFNRGVTLIVREAPPFDSSSGNITMMPSSQTTDNLWAQFDDRDGTVQSIDWIEVTSNGATLGLPTTVNLPGPTNVRSTVNVTLPNLGDYTFRATARDNDGLSTVSDITIHKNLLPVVPAIANQVIQVPGTLTTNFVAAGVNGGEGPGVDNPATFTYLWTLTSGPSTAPTLGGANTNNLSVTVNQSGLHVFSLTVTDNFGGVTVVPNIELDARLVCPAGMQPDILSCNYNWAEHTCGSGGLFASKMFEGFDTAKTLINPKLACCLNGSATVDPGTNNCSVPVDIGNANCAKFDCIQTVVTATGNTAFDNLYNAPGGDPVADAGLTFPNRLFLVDSSGRPVTGFYNERGERCLIPNQRPSQQMALYDAMAIPAGMDVTCRFLVRAALQTMCPTNTGAGVGLFRSAGLAGTPVNATNTGAVVRCPAASQITVHLDITDVSDPTALQNMKKISFRRTNSVQDPRAPTDRSSGQLLLPAEIDMSAIISQKFAACPPGYVNNGGICEQPN